MDKPWRLHVANSAIHFLDIIDGDPALVAVWTRDGQVAYYDLERGALHGASKFVLPENTKDYWPFVQTLKDLKDRRLAFARVGRMTFWPLENGSVLEYYGGATVELYQNADETPQTLTFDVKPLALALDPETQLVAAVDPKGALLLGKLGGTIKTMRPGLKPDDELPVSVVVGRGGKRIVASDGTTLVVIDSGKVTAKRELHYSCGQVALSPDGKVLLTFDSDSGVIRAYTPGDLRLTRQRFVIDLLSSADELQLIAFAELPPMNAAVSALVVQNSGLFAFAVAGQLCVASAQHLAPTDAAPVVSKPTPQPDKPASKPVPKSTATPASTTAKDNKSATEPLKPAKRSDLAAAASAAKKEQPS